MDHNSIAFPRSRVLLFRGTPRNAASGKSDFPVRIANQAERSLGKIIPFPTRPAKQRPADKLSEEAEGLAQLVFQRFPADGIEPARRRVFEALEALEQAFLKGGL